MSSRANGSRQNGDDDEVCPVCKSSRYLNPDMRFLINPECYHKMCESCVDRIFSSGPAPCPVAGCRKTLRKNKFRKQTFGDLAVEREVDIRKRVMGILNRREDEFDNKRAWDDFLEQREEIIANLVYETDVAKTEAQLAQYSAANSASIRHNKDLARQEYASFEQHQSEEQEELRRRREAARQDYENERKAKLASREDIISRLVTGDAADAAAVARESEKAHQLKKSSARRSEEERIKRKQAALRAAETAGKGPLATGAAGSVPGNAAAGGAGLIKGLRKIKTPEPEKPYDPFAGAATLNSRDYYKLQEQYPSSYLDPLREDARVLAGGYDLREYYERTLLEAFAGLGCFVGEEVTAREKLGSASSSSMATPSAQRMSAKPSPTSSLPAKRRAHGTESKAQDSDDLF
ncbi:RNA polymerase II transcription factor B subunit 3 [Arthroderma uncinatum]|uniref:RNA polymerase II transcription factor B subunit 3 n=1 Tax=Arthroderma uncinatum TaxID=74035 RepID=UPI00144A74B6|nr:RNA polymerase II transcription factor B subunit 3 [Arthroderma uncinatum]KAF3483870.1 RNA polymerase II transcription factor B subunit 3 [Arthroderma uncinatum]